MRWVLIWISISGLSLGAWAGPKSKPSAAAAEADLESRSPEALYKEGVERFKAEDFEAAAARFEAAFTKDPAPTLLFNLARAYEEMGDLERAAARYADYLERFEEGAEREDAKRRHAKLKAKRAEALYQEGVALFKAKQFQKAAGRFEAAFNADPAPTLLYNLARAYEEMGDPKSAVARYKTFLERFPDAPDAEDVQKRVRLIEAVFAAAQQGTLIIQGAPPGARISLNDEPPPESPEPRWQLKPGQWRVRVDGAEGLWIKTVTLGAGQTLRLTYAPPPPSPWRMKRVLGWSLVALGGLSLLNSVGKYGEGTDTREDYDAALEALDAHAESERQEALNGRVGPYSQAVNEERDSLEQVEKEFIGALAIGIISAGVGGGLLYWDSKDLAKGPKPATQSTSVPVEARVFPFMGGMGLELRF